MPVIIPEEGRNQILSPTTESCDTFVEQFLASNRTFFRWDNYEFWLIFALKWFDVEHIGHITPLWQNPFSCGHDDLIFDWTVVRSSLTADMGFTCDNDHLFSIFNAGYMLGMLTGAFVLGIIADKASWLELNLNLPQNQLNLKMNLWYLVPSTYKFVMHLSLPSTKPRRQ